MTDDTIPITLSPKYEIMPTGLAIREPLTFAEWLDCGHVLWRIKQSVQWCIGDWVLYGERQYGEMYAQALEDTHYQYGSLRNLVSLAGKIELSRRHDNLSWSHHSAVAALEVGEQDRMLDEAEANGWTREELRGVVIDLNGDDRKVPAANPGNRLRKLEAVADAARDYVRWHFASGEVRLVEVLEVLDGNEPGKKRKP